MCDDFPNETRNNIQAQLGNILNNIRQITVAKTDIANGISVDANTELITRYRTEIDTLFEQLPRLDYFENLSLSCDSKAFFETLIMTVKNISLSAQYNFYKIKNITKTQLINQVKRLKEN